MASPAATLVNAELLTKAWSSSGVITPRISKVSVSGFNPSSLDIQNLPMSTSKLQPVSFCEMVKVHVISSDKNNLHLKKKDCTFEVEEVSVSHPMSLVSAKYCLAA